MDLLFNEMVQLSGARLRLSWPLAISVSR
jgi:hypothetical protein